MVPNDYDTISISTCDQVFEINMTPQLERSDLKLKTTFSTEKMVDLQRDKFISMVYLIGVIISPLIYIFLVYLNTHILSGASLGFKTILLVFLMILPMKFRLYLMQERLTTFLMDFLLCLSIIYQLFLFVVIDWGFIEKSVFKIMLNFGLVRVPSIMVLLLIAQVCLFFSSIFLPKHYQNIRLKKLEKVKRVILELLIIFFTIGFLLILARVGKENFGAVTAVEVALLSIRPNQFLALNFGAKYLDKEVTLNVKQKFLRAKFFLTLFYVSWAIDAYSELSIKKLVTSKNKALYDAMGFNIAGNFFDKFYSIAIPFILLFGFFMIFTGIIQGREKEFNDWIIQESDT